MKFPRIPVIPIILAVLVQAMAAHSAVLEFDIYYGIGFPDFSFSNAPLALSVYPWKNFGLSSGLEYSMRKKIKSHENVEASMNIIDNDGDDLVFKYHIDKYSEELSTQLLQIPVLLKFRSSYFYAGAGVKIGIPQNVKVNMSYKGLKTDGYLPELDAHLHDLPGLGFIVQQDSSYETKIKAKTLFMLALESGVRIKLNKNFALLFGAFADYALNKGFNRNLPNTVEWVEYINEASVNVSDGWKEWQPWSVGGVAKLSFIFGGKE
ncbi:MAG: hypothetical protein LBB36_01190 [Fibromonadaceae bacterium]|jgi:hypothetical protein|nr:hypothetical protein [Fibromonadaceae bacterium]